MTGPSSESSARPVLVTRGRAPRGRRRGPARQRQWAGPTDAARALLDRGRPGDGRRPAATDDRLPRLLAGERRRHFAALVGTGLGQAAAAGVGAWVLSRAFGTSSGDRAGAILLLLGVAVAVGALRLWERVLAEMLSQHYVHQLRMSLLEASLGDAGPRSLGVTVARTTNDLTAVRNWAALGVAPLASGLPLIVGAGLVLAVLEPLLALAALAPLLMLAVALVALSPPTYRRARRVRKARGRLAGQIADVVLASGAVRAGGGEARELRRISRLSQGVVDTAIARSRVAGGLRGVAAAATGVATATVAGVGLFDQVPTATIAAAVTIVGVMASPVHDMGRVVEYRQSYLAARRIIGPVLAGRRPAPSSTTGRPVPLTGSAEQGGLSVAGLRLDESLGAPDLAVPPGSRVLLDTEDRRTATLLLETLAGLRAADGVVLVDGEDLLTADGEHRRALVGYAAQGMRLERGTLGRALRYRVPDAAADDTERLWERLGLSPLLAGLPRGERTLLRHGGDPLTVPDRARVLLARALLGNPPLLVLDHLDGDLGQAGRAGLVDVLADFPGVVVLAADDPGRLVGVTHTWRPVGAGDLR